LHGWRRGYECPVLECLLVLLRLALGAVVPTAWQLSRAGGSLCQDLLNPVVWREPDGRSLSMGPLVEALVLEQGRIRDAIGYLYLMQLSPSSRRP